jgi:peptide-methionine (S)-S-oxide reductase
MKPPPNLLLPSSTKSDYDSDGDAPILIPINASFNWRFYITINIKTKNTCCARIAEDYQIICIKGDKRGHIWYGVRISTCELATLLTKLISYCYLVTIICTRTASRCFWEPAESLLKQPGVLDTTVGYTGASLNKPPPTYDTVCFGNDYVEAVQVVYDDNIVRYNQLLDYFFEFQKPGIKRQYASVVFVDEGSEDGKDEARKVLAWKEEAMLSKGKRKDNLPYEIVQVEPLTKFYRAESYHQRYWEKQRLRAFVGLLLIAGASGAYDTLFDGAVGDLSFFGWSFDTLCNAAFLVGAGWMLLERLIARDVQELKRGDLMDSFVRGST